MKNVWIRLRSYMERGLRRQLVFYLILGVILPLVGVTSILFVRARQEMKKQAIANISHQLESIAGKIDELVFNVEGVSDKFAYDEEISALIERKYEKRSLEKQRDTYELKSYFSKTDPFGNREQISAIYTRNTDVFNFAEPYRDGEEIEKKMQELGAEDKAILSIFQWKPLQDNFLTSVKTGSPRQDQVVIGIRRIMQPFTGTFRYTQFFAIQEQKFYEIYEKSVGELGGIAYLLDSEGNLISSSDEKAVAEGRVSEEIIQALAPMASQDSQIAIAGDTMIRNRRKLEHVDWELMIMVPVSTATRSIDKLFQGIILVMAACTLACLLIINWISKRYLRPVEVLDESMKAVYHGNLKAYVEPDLYNGEMKSMMIYYNSMLKQINHFIHDQVENEKKKKELELEVLMGQINPHFLYNTLENIVWKSNEVGRPDIGRMAAALGRLYRLSIGNGETIVSIRQEAEHVMAYINIQKNRYKEKMEFDLKADYKQIWGYGMIKLTLQPVIENCFMYAMEDIDHVLRIRLKIQVKQQVIQMRIIDNGCGMSKGQLLEVRKRMQHGKVRSEGISRRRKGTGIGLYSVRERIAIYTGYQDSVRIYSKKGIGTMVIITIPQIVLNDKGEKKI